jgi:hypothetical protein
VDDAPNILEERVPRGIAPLGEAFGGASHIDEQHDRQLAFDRTARPRPHQKGGDILHRDIEHRVVDAVAAAGNLDETRAAVGSTRRGHDGLGVPLGCGRSPP